MSYNKYTTSANNNSSSTTQSPFQSYATTPRNSFCYQNLQNPVKCELIQRGEKVNLAHVYKVIRFYSFWKTCTSFHRIVTMIEKITDNKTESLIQSNFGVSTTATGSGTSTLDNIIEIASTTKSFTEDEEDFRTQKESEITDNIITEKKNLAQPFKKRMFVQYLWRNAKLQEKVRVQKEFDPRRQRLLKFVTDTQAQKRVSY